MHWTLGGTGTRTLLLIEKVTSETNIAGVKTLGGGSHRCGTIPYCERRNMAQHPLMFKLKGLGPINWYELSLSRRISCRLAIDFCRSCRVHEHGESFEDPQPVGIRDSSTAGCASVPYCCAFNSLLTRKSCQRVPARLLPRQGRPLFHIRSKTNQPHLAGSCGTARHKPLDLHSAPVRY